MNRYKKWLAYTYLVIGGVAVLILINSIVPVPFDIIGYLSLILHVINGLFLGWLLRIIKDNYIIPEKKKIPPVQTVTDTAPDKVFATTSTNPSINCAYTPLIHERLIGAGIVKAGGGMNDIDLSSLITKSKNLGITPRLVFEDENIQETPAEAKPEYNPNKVELGTECIDLEAIGGMDISSPNEIYYYLVNDWKNISYNDKFTPEDGLAIYEQWRKL